MKEYGRQEEEDGTRDKKEESASQIEGEVGVRTILTYPCCQPHGGEVLVAQSFTNIPRFQSDHLEYKMSIHGILRTLQVLHAHETNSALKLRSKEEREVGLEQPEEVTPLIGFGTEVKGIHA